MTLSKVRGFLEVATSVPVLLGAAVVIYVGLWGHFHGSAKPQLSVGLRTGSLLTSPPNILYGDAPRTLIIALNTECGYCEASVPFYKRLAELQNKAAEGSRLIAVFPNGEADVNQFVQRHHLNLETASSVDFGSLKVTGTPTLILINANGEVRNFWIGKLSQDQEQQIIRSLTAPEV